MFRDVHMFVRQAKQVARTKDSVASNLYLCLRGSAMTWFMAFKPHRQDALCEDLNYFCDALIQKYKQTHSQVFDKLHAEHYTMEDAKNRRPADDYIQTILLHGQSCEQSTTAILTLVWKNLDRELQRDVRRPSDDADNFVRDLDESIEFWASESSVLFVKKSIVRFDSNPRTFTKDKKEAAYQRGLDSSLRYNQTQSAHRP